MFLILNKKHNFFQLIKVKIQKFNKFFFNQILLNVMD